MDLATKLFSLSFGVEPNKATLKDLSEIFNSAGIPSNFPTLNLTYHQSNLLFKSPIPHREAEGTF